MTDHMKKQFPSHAWSRPKRGSGRPERDHPRATVSDLNEQCRQELLTYLNEIDYSRLASADAAKSRVGEVDNVEGTLSDFQTRAIHWLKTMPKSQCDFRGVYMPLLKLAVNVQADVDKGAIWCVDAKNVALHLGAFLLDALSHFPPEKASASTERVIAYIARWNDAVSIAQSAELQYEKLRTNSAKLEKLRKRVEEQKESMRTKLMSENEEDFPFQEAFEKFMGEKDASILTSYKTPPEIIEVYKKLTRCAIDETRATAMESFVKADEHEYMLLCNQYNYFTSCMLHDDVFVYLGIRQPDLAKA